MILTYEKFNPFRNKVISEEDIDTIRDLFLEIEDNIKYVQLNEDDDFELLFPTSDGDCFMTNIIDNHRKYVIIICLSPWGLTSEAFTKKREMIIDRLMKFINRINKFGFDGKLDTKDVGYYSIRGDRMNISITK